MGFKSIEKMTSDKVKLILNSMFLAPMFLEGNSDVVRELNLSGDDLRQLEKLIPFIEYNLQFVKEGKGDYEKLREGLDAYFKLYLRDIFKVIGMTNIAGKFLDFGAGDGSYSRQYKIDNPEAEIYELERNRGMKIDFEKSPDWWKEYLYHFDVVLVSELLHCKDINGKIKILSDCNNIIKSGGSLLICENEDVFMDYRLKKVTKGGSMMTRKDVMYLLDGYPEFELIDSHIFKSHNVLVYEKL